MLNCKKFFQILDKNEIVFFSGVPDSLLKFFNSYILDNVNDKNHIIAANEGASIALAAGHYLATKKIGLVYMQNSGLGNAINPLVSLTDQDVYSIPVLLVIGWRGEPNKKDEPQHVKQGRITPDLLQVLKIPYNILSENISEAEKEIEKAVRYMQEFKAPYALIVKKGTFEEYKQENKVEQNYEMTRENAIKIILESLEKNDIVISTTGMISREVFENRENRKEKHESDFMSVGSMGHASQIALGIALSKQDNQVFCLDGDGSVIMHMGALGIIGTKQVKNFKHIILNNESHDSVGGQPTIGDINNFATLAKSCNYKNSFRAINKIELTENMQKLKMSEGPSLLEIKVKQGNRKDLGRPTTSPKENKNIFMDFLSK